MGRGRVRQKAELLPGTLETLILKTVECKAGLMHGYGIAQYIKQISHEVLPGRGRLALSRASAIEAQKLG